MDKQPNAYNAPGNQQGQNGGQAPMGNYPPRQNYPPQGGQPPQGNYAQRPNQPPMGAQPPQGNYPPRPNQPPMGTQPPQGNYAQRPNQPPMGAQPPQGNYPPRPNQPPMGTQPPQGNYPPRPNQPPQGTQPPQRPNFAQQPQGAPGFCTRCGNRNAPGNKFCTKCGQPIAAAAAPRSPEEANRFNYDRANELFAQRRYDEALHAFANLGNYADSAEKVKQCTALKEGARKEAIYQRAVAVISKEKTSDAEINNAINDLNTIPEYKDSKEKVKDLQDKLAKWLENKKVNDELAKKNQYAKGLECFEASDFDRALLLFRQLGDYNDSKAYVEKCIAGQENARKERTYQESIAVLTDETLSDKKFNDAIAALASIEGYKDAKEKKAEIEERYANWTEAKKAAAEAERIRLAKIKAKKRRIVIISIAAVLLVALIACLTIFLIIPTVQYNNADALFEEGKYSEALEIYEGLNFKNSESRIVVINSITKIDEQDYGNAVKNLLQAGVPVDIVYDCVGGDVSGNEYLEGDHGFANLGSSDTLEKATFSYSTYDEFDGIKTPDKEGFYFVKWETASYDYELDGKFTLSLTATWSLTEYKIEYDLQGGVVDGSNIIKYYMESDPFTLINPTRAGYTFAGWTSEDNDTPSLTMTIQTGTVGDKEFIANWTANEYTVTLDANGGSVDAETVTATYDKNTTLPTPTKEGYTFAGWFDDTKKYETGTWKTASDITLTATWTANEYTVTLDDYGKKDITVTFYDSYYGSSSTQTLSEGETLAYPSDPYDRSGYIFAGWFTDESCTDRYDFDSEITGDMTLYAGWTYMSMSNAYAHEQIDPAYYDSSSYSYSSYLYYTSNSSRKHYYVIAEETGTHTVYHKGGYYDDYYIGIYNLTKGTTILSNTEYSDNDTYDSVEFECSKGDIIVITVYCYWSYDGGYVYLYFDGFDSASSTAYANNSEFVYNTDLSYDDTATYGTEYTLPELSQTGYTFLGWYNGDEKVESGIWSITSDVILTPMWEINTYNLTFDPNGGTVSEESLTISYGYYCYLPTPVREGYTFNGWYSGDKQYTSGTWTELSDVALVASWTANSYNVTYNNTVSETIYVTYDYNYYDGYSYSVSLTDGDYLSYPEDPTRSDYVFTGWYTDSSCTSRYDFNSDITEDTTLYAGWKSMSMSYVYSEYTIDPTEYTSSDYYYSTSMYDTSSSYKKHIYLAAQETGAHSIYYAYSSDPYYMSVYNLTTGSQIMSNTYIGSSSYESINFNCSAGDVIVISLYNYYTYSYYDYGYAYLYFEGFSSATSNAYAACSEYVYEYGSSHTVSVEYDSEYTLPTPTRTGYRFIGWYVGETLIDFDTWNIASDVTLTPGWREVEIYEITLNDTSSTYSSIYVTFEHNCSEYTDYTVGLSNGETLSIPENPERSGYVFTGWYTDPSCTSEYSFSGSITDHMTLYAGWEYLSTSNSSSYPWYFSDGVLYSSNKSNSSSSSYTITATRYMTVSFRYRTSSESGWDYLYIKKNGSTLKSCSGETSYSEYSVTLYEGDYLTFTYYKDGSSSSGYDCAYISDLTITADVVTYSDATASCSDVTESVYVEGATSTIRVEYGESFTLPTPTRDGYTFVGWFNGDEQVEAGTWLYEEDITLTPVWE